MKLTHRRAIAVALILVTFSASLLGDAPADSESHALGAAAEGYTPASGSLVEGLDGALYVGVGKDGASARLVEFDPYTGDARVAVDVHELLSLHGPAAQGYAAQARIATRNYVGPSGRVYFGTTHGNATEEEKKANTRFGGGYVIAYDPRTGLAEHFDMPMPRHGVADVIADEARELMYVVTDATDELDGEGAHWVLYDKNSPNRGEYGMPGKYRELGPRLARGAVTLIDARGVASALTSDWRIAQYEPEQDRLSVRGINLGEQPLSAPAAEGNKTITSLSWSLGQDGRTAYAVRSDDGTVYAIDLLAPRGSFEAKAVGQVAGASAAPLVTRSGHVFLVSDNGVSRLDPASGKIEADEKVQPPASTVGLVAASDGTMYAVSGEASEIHVLPAHRTKTDDTPARAYIAAALAACDRIEADLPRMTKVAEVVAERHIAGGHIDFPWNYQSLQQELAGRAGGVMHYGRPFKENRTEADRAKDVAIIGWEKPPGADELTKLQDLKKAGVYVIGFGPKVMPELKEIAKVCDAFFNTGEDHLLAVPIAGGKRAGRLAPLINCVQAWTFTAEFVAALTRQGKMPTMWMAYLYPGGVDWGNRYTGVQFHDDYKVAPVPAGELGIQFLTRVRWHVRAFENTQLPEVNLAADLIARERAGGKKTVSVSAGHMAWTLVGRYEDEAWATPFDLHMNVYDQVDGYRRADVDGALVLRLGYCGFHKSESELFQSKHNRVLLITAPHESPNFRYAANLPVQISTMAAFGDACVTIKGYPLRMFPVTGWMQVLAYESVNVEVLDRMGKPQPAEKTDTAAGQ